MFLEDDILQDSGQTGASADVDLLAAFDAQIAEKTPHEVDGRVTNATPLVDLTRVLVQAAKDEFGMDLAKSDFTVYGKVEAELPGGSVKTRPAVRIMRDAIASGRLKREQVVFEATSGNFGIALGLLGKLGVSVVVLVSRKLQGGVLDELERSGVKTINLDVDICPAPGVQMDPNLLVAKIVAGNMRDRLQELGLSVETYDRWRDRVEKLLGAQDVINLAKLLAEAYGGFCPAQYENELNPAAHQAVTGPELEQQLNAMGRSLSDFNIVCAFGTGGTSTGLSRYTQQKFGKKPVHVIFPQEGQDVAGIRTRSKASGLAFYQPDLYGGQHDVDFQQAKKLLVYLAKKHAVNMGESSALALFAVLQMVNFGIKGNFVVILADGIEKYRSNLNLVAKEDIQGRLEVTEEQARDHIDEYGAIVWTHPGYRPNEEGVKVVVSALGKAGATLEVMPAMEVARAVGTGQVSPAALKLVENRPGRVLLVCMAGVTSLRMAQMLTARGIKTQSLSGGMTNLAREEGKPVLALVRPAT